MPIRALERLEVRFILRDPRLDLVARVLPQGGKAGTFGAKTSCQKNQQLPLLVGRESMGGPFDLRECIHAAMMPCLFTSRNAASG